MLASPPITTYACTKAYGNDSRSTGYDGDDPSLWVWEVTMAIVFRLEQ
jgi:hypothetical protein